jgi:phosphoribosylformylglycinamidine synthase
VGVTNCLNFGNPEKPEIMWQFQEVIAGIAEACNTFAIPITGGNVSFYNDTEGLSIYPTPVLGVVGIVDDISSALSPGFKAEETPIVLLGTSKEELGATEYLKYIHNLEKGLPPQIDLAKEKKVQELCLEANSQELLLSAHDTSEGGLAICAAECTFLSHEKIGFRLDINSRLRSDALLFGESQSRILVTVSAEKLTELLEMADRNGVEASVLGTTGGQRIIIRHQEQEIINIPVDKAFLTWKNAIPDFFKTKR